MRTHMIFDCGYERPRIHDAEELTGMTPRFVPRHNVNVGCEGLAVRIHRRFRRRYLGGSPSPTTTRYSSTATRLLREPSGYRADRWEWLLNVDNLFNNVRYFFDDTSTIWFSPGSRSPCPARFVSGSTDSGTREVDLVWRSAPYSIIMIPYGIRGGILVANVLVRDLDDDVLKQLKAAAKAHGRSLQAEIHDVLRRASIRNLAETRRLSAQWLKRLRHSPQSDSAASIREDRDTR